MTKLSLCSRKTQTKSSNCIKEDKVLQYRNLRSEAKVFVFYREVHPQGVFLRVSFIHCGNNIHLYITLKIYVNRFYIFYDRYKKCYYIFRRVVNMSEVLLERLAVMLFFMIPGYVLYKKRIITDAGTKDIGKLLIYIILPSAIVNSYNIGFSAEKAVGLLLSFVLAALTLLLSVIISKAVFGKRNAIESFGAAFSNAGFMGIPLVSSVIGSDAVYYAAAFVAMLNILQWTYGVYTLTGSKEAISPKKVLLNPVLISFFIGVILFLLPVKLPSFFAEILSTVAGMNAPIAMLTVGIYLAQIPLKTLFSDKMSYKVSAVRLLLIPTATSALLALLPFGDAALKLTVLILASAPIGSNVAVYAQIYGCDHRQAVREVVQSTILCIVTMPLIIGISDCIFQNIPLWYHGSV